MLRKLLLTVIITGAATTLLFAQGSIKVTLKDAKSGETVPFAPVLVMSGTQQIASGQTDIDGECMMKQIPAGKYDIKASNLGYNTQTVKGFTVMDNKTNYAEIKLNPSITELQTVEVVDYKVPIIDPDTKSGGNLTKDQIKNNATKSVTSLASQKAGIFQAKEGGELNIRGSRGDGTVFFIDGMRVIGGIGLSQQSYEQISVTTGGQPASIGDATGGTVSITTRGPQPKYTGALELISSQLTDAYGYNSAIFSVGGPIWAKKDSTGGKDVKLGFFLSGQATTTKDDDPSAIGVYQINKDTLKYLEENPLRQAPTTAGTYQNAAFVTNQSFEKVKAKQNIRNNQFQLSGKIQYKPIKNLEVVLGGSVDYNKRHEYIYEYAMFNSSNNPLKTEETYRGFMRITQRFGNPSDTASKSASNLKNTNYSILVNYTKNKEQREDDTHGDRFFDYGYLGHYKTYKEKAYSSEEELDTISQITTIVQTGYVDTLVTFNASDINKNGARFTSQYYEIFKDSKEGRYENYAQLQQGNALRNGDNPLTVYNMWYSTGRQVPGFYKQDKDQYRIAASFSTDIKKHEIQVGFEFEQRKESYWSITAVPLWRLARQLTNTHITELDKSQPQINYYADGFRRDTITYPTLVNKDAQENFDKNLREAVGAREDEWIDIDDYDPTVFNLNMFSADELLNKGSGIGGSPNIYYGYDIYGTKLNYNPSFDDFFTKKDDQGRHTRDVAAFQPIYLAGYIQDKFDFKDLKFNIGLRVDRFDANQKVLIDKYSFYETKKAGEVSTINNQAITHPTNIGEEYVVYVDDLNNPTSIIGYRNEDRWYNAEGTEIADPKILAEKSSSGSITPYLVNPDIKITGEDYVPSTSFKDYVPQINLQPRLAFAFPISDMANFFAHYDVLTQRPTSGAVRMNPLDYLFITSDQGNILNNPDLKPTKTTDYELGFTQVLSEAKNSAITLSGTYREMRDMIQLSSINYAYPRTYTTYRNIDFGTYKGLSASYDLRRTGNIEFNVNYTLSFADATGSSATSGLNLANSGVPNLRTLQPAEYDQRHIFVTNFDYRYGKGSDYNGPIWAKAVLESFGANLTFRAGSGLPYTQQSNVTMGDATSGNVVIGVSQKGFLKGNINGARLPFQYRADLRVEKTLAIKVSGNEGAVINTLNMNIYVQVLNLFNQKNIVDVYKFSGTAGDDGYLANAASQNAINSQIYVPSFIDLYNAKVNNPAFFSIPRQIRVGVALDF